MENGRNESDFGDNTTSGGAAADPHGASGSVDGGRSGSGVDAARRENHREAAGSYAGSDSGERASDGSGNPPGTGNGGSGSGSSPRNRDWGKRLRKWADSSTRTRNSSGSNDTEEEGSVSSRTSAVSVEFGDAEDVQPVRRRGRPPGSGAKGVGKLVYQRAAELCCKTPFYVAAIWTHYREFKLDEDEWNALKEPATNLAQKHMPLGWANGVTEASDWILLGQALIEIYDRKTEGYKLAKLEADKRAEQVEQQLTNRNGFYGQSEVPLSDLLQRN